jgi:hypothetical protein
VPFRGNEIRDHRRVRRAADRTKSRRDGRQRQAGEQVVADREKAQEHRGLGAPAEQDHRPAAGVVRDVAARIRREAREQRADEERHG